MALFSDFLEEEEVVDLEEDSVNSNHHPVRRTSNTSMSDQLSSAFSTISSKDQTGRDSKGQILTRERLYSRLKAKRKKRRIKEDDDYGYYKHTLQEGEQRRMEKESQHRHITEADHETLTDQRKSIEEGDDATMLIHGRRSLKWVSVSPAEQSNKIASLRLIKAFKNPQRSMLYTLASHILNNHARSASQEKEDKSSKISITRPHPPKGTPKPPMEIFPGVFLYQTASGKKLVDFSMRWKFMKRQNSWPKLDHKPPRQQRKHSSPLSPTVQVKDFPSSSITDLPPLSSDLTGTNSSDKREAMKIRTTQASEMEEEFHQTEIAEIKDGAASEYSYEDEESRPGWAEDTINWQRTFSVNPIDFELLRSDWNDLRCNVSGNLQLAESEALEVISHYVERINKFNGG